MTFLHILKRSSSAWVAALLLTGRCELPAGAECDPDRFHSICAQARGLHSMAIIPVDGSAR